MKTESAKPGARNRILSTRFSQSEYSALEHRAWQAGKTVADWAREILLRNWNGSSPAEIQNHIFTELVAVELALMNGLEPLLRGEKLSREQASQMFREVQATKAARAQEILLKRGHAREK